MAMHHDDDAGIVPPHLRVMLQDVIHLFQRMQLIDHEIVLTAVQRRRSRTHAAIQLLGDPIEDRIFLCDLNEPLLHHCLHV